MKTPTREQLSGFVKRANEGKPIDCYLDAINREMIRRAKQGEVSLGILKYLSTLRLASPNPLQQTGIVIHYRTRGYTVTNGVISWE